MKKSDRCTLAFGKCESLSMGPGYTVCRACFEMLDVSAKAIHRRRARKHQNRKNWKEVYRSLGLKRACGALGGVYWE